MLILSPSLTRSSFNTPAEDDGISIDALSDSTVTNDCSTLMVSPNLTSTSMTVTSLKSPMSGTRISIATGAPLVAAGWAGAAAGTAALFAPESVAVDVVETGASACFVSETGVSAAAEPSASSSSTTLPCLTLSPSWTLSSLTTPAALDGISIDALSDSTVNSDWSALMVSPGFTSSSITVTSSKSPISGT